ncbi:MAG: hypothetical protein ACR2QE_20650 [Acidimicrobiales bacterium]
MTVKKGRHRRFEEARALKRSRDVDYDDLFDSLNPDDDNEPKPEHEAWADLAEESEDDDPGADLAAEHSDGDDEESTAESA